MNSMIKYRKYFAVEKPTHVPPVNYKLQPLWAHQKERKFVGTICLILIQYTPTQY